MKQWKLILVTLLAVLMVCVCTSAMAEEHVCKSGPIVVTNGTCVQVETYDWYDCTDKNCPNGNYKAGLKGLEGAKDATNHVGETVVVAKRDATCVDAGQKYYEYCSACGAVTKGVNETYGIDKTAHTTIKHVSSKAATCVAEGQTPYDYCVDCKAVVAGENKVLPIDKDAHGKSIHVSSKAPTCFEAGQTAYDYCELCKKVVAGENKVLPIVHDLHKSESNSKPATCTEDGYEWWHCSKCEYAETKILPSKGGHNFVYEQTVAPKCETEGYKKYVCSACGEVDKRDVKEALNHKFTTPYDIVAATCTKEGVEQYKCSNTDCDEKGERKVLAKLPHTYTKKTLNNRVAPTCEADGFENYQCDTCGKANVSENVVLTKLGHKFKHVLNVKPTCTTEGYDYYICENGCKYTMNAPHKDNVVEALGHDFSVKTKYTVEPTCEEDGYTWYTCAHEGCTSTEKKDIVEATGHTMTAVAGHKDPTCTEDGYHRAKCADCGELDETEVLEKTGHHYTIKHAVNEPTCQKDGNTVYKCEDCNTYEARDVQPKVDHKFEKKGATKNPTCENDGYTWYHCTFTGCTETAKKDIVTKTGHNYVLEQNNLPTCQEKGVQVYHCYNTGCETNTKTVEIEKLPHQYSETQWTWVAEPNCTETGRKAYLCIMCAKQTKYVDVDALGHNFEGAKIVPFTGHDATCTEAGEGYQQCQNNGCTFVQTAVIEAKGHEFNEKYFYHKPATCTEDGLKKYACVRSNNGVHCEEIKYEPISATGHTYEETVLVKPTCTTQGMKVITCEDCDYQKYELIAADGHGKMVEVSKTEATCTKAGEIVKKCEVCAESVVEVIPATGHTNTKEEIVKAPTCTEAGSNKVVCTVCGETVETKEVPALGHGATEEKAVKAATCTEAGSVEVVCTVCGDVLETKEVAALGHGATEEKAVKAATCTEAGSVEVVCTVCGEVQETEEVAALGHDMVAGAVTAPTCTEKGYTTYECSRCDASEQKDETAALGHNYEWVMDAVVASPAAPGENWYQCSVCEDVADIEYVKYTKYYYENTLTSFGPTTEELLGEGDWYRVTPIDLSVDGIYTFDLIASNAYVVGTVTITVSEGVMTVSYDVNANHIEVLEEALVLYASKADLAEGKGVTVAFGEEINLAETFGEDSKVLVSLMLTGTYDAAGYGVYGFEADAEEIADLLAIVD